MRLSQELLATLDGRGYLEEEGYSEQFARVSVPVSLLASASSLLEAKECVLPSPQ